MGKIGLQEIDKECYSMYAIVEASPVRILVLNILVYPPARSLEYKNMQLISIHSASKYMAFYSTFHICVIIQIIIQLLDE
jgi:hypothetical protein